MELLKELCNIHAPSGSEESIKTFILNYIEEHKAKWRYQPEVIFGDDIQDCIILKFGDPKTAIFAHMDSVGFMVRYENQLVPIGGPEIQSGYTLCGHDGLGPIECTLEVDEENSIFYNFFRPIQTGATLVFKSNFRETKEFVQSCYMDNRLGVYNALKLAETIKDGVIVFSTYEEHGGGSVPFLTKYIYKNYNIRQALISDITWVTDGVQPGNGVVISLRDKNIPRKQYLDKIISIAQKSGIQYQLEVETSGSSDGRELQLSPYPIDWCFIGAPEQNVHSPDEKVHINDIQAMIDMYAVLMKEL